MNYLLGFLVMMMTAVVQSTLLSYIHFLGGTVDLPLLVTLAWTLAGDWEGGIVWGFIGGLFLDLLSGGPAGAGTLSLTLTAYLASLAEGRFWRSHVLLPLGTALIGTLTFHGLYLTILTSAGHALDWHACVSYVTLPSAVLNTLAVLPIYYLMRWLYNVLFPPPVTM